MFSLEKTTSTNIYMLSFHVEVDVNVKWFVSVPMCYNSILYVEMFTYLVHISLAALFEIDREGVIL